MATTFDELIGKLHEVARILRDLEGEPTPDGIKKLRDPAGELAKALVLIRNQANRRVRTQAQAAAALKAILQEVSLGGFEEGVELESFFEDVSTSMVSAQRALDKRSAEYLRERDPNVPPAYFAIPNVKAEMKVGFTKTSKRGVNLIFFSKQQKAEDYGESTVSFEVVSAPPGPDALPYGRYLVPIPRFLVLEDERERILDWLAATEKPADSYQHLRELALVAGRDTEEGRSYLVFWPGQQENRVTWDRLRIYHVLETRGGALELDRGAWQEPWGNQAPPPPVDDVEIVNYKSTPPELRRAGHAVNLLLEFLAQWRESVTLPGSVEG